MLDLKKLRQDATYVATEQDGYAATVAAALIQIIDHPGLVVPAGWRLVKEPELRGKGVPYRP